MHTRPTCSPAQRLSAGAQPYPSRQKLRCREGVGPGHRCGALEMHFLPPEGLRSRERGPWIGGPSSGCGAGGTRASSSHSGHPWDPVTAAWLLWDPTPCSVRQGVSGGLRVSRCPPPMRKKPGLSWVPPTASVPHLSLQGCQLPGAQWECLHSRGV